MNDNVEMKMGLFGVIVENADEVRHQFNLRFGNDANLWNLFCAALSSEWAAYNSKKGPKEGSVTVEEIKQMSA